MFLQVDRFAESFITIVALEGQVRFVGVPQHVNAERSQDRRFVIAFFAHVTR